MPEGPEVRIIAEWLRDKCKGKYCLNLLIDINSKYTKYKMEGFEYIVNLFPLYISDITYKGKHIFFHLLKDNTKYYLHSTLGMKGHWRLDKKYNNKSGKTHSNLWLNIFDENGIFELYYDDSAHFGNINILTEDGYQNKIKEIGPDLLNENVTWDLYYNKIIDIMNRTKTLDIASFLLEQKYFSGVGNYLKSDILYLSGLNPLRNIKTLSKEDIWKMYYYSIYLIQLSYSLGGMKIKTFVNPFKSDIDGYIPFIYGKKIDSYGNKILIDSSKRTTYWVKEIQT